MGKLYKVANKNKIYIVDASSDIEAVNKVRNSAELEDDRLSPMTYKKLKEMGYSSEEWSRWDQKHANEVVAKGRKEDPNKNIRSKETKKYIRKYFTEIQ